MPESVSGTYSMSDAANGSLSSPIATSLQVSDDDCSRTDPERDCLEPEITASSESECNRSNVHDYSSNSEVDVDCGIEEDRKWFSWRLLLAYSGPGWLMSIAYLDPGNIESDLQAGAYSGYHCVWVLFWCHVLGLVLQTLSARLGVVTGKNLAQICRKEYSRPVSIGLWLMTELAIIGSDIQEVVGSAIAFKVLFKLDLWIGCLITGFDTFTFLAIHYFGVKKLEYFFGVLILVMLISFWVEFGEDPSPVSSIASGFVPIVPNYAVVQAVGIVGAVIMPHNIYLHSALVQSRKVDRKNPSKVHSMLQSNIT